MVEIRDLYKYFGNLEVLSGINLSIPDGKIYGLAGKSGVGKSTLLRCINGLTPYDKGSLTVDGVEIASLKGRELRETRQKIGMVFQQFSLLERLNVFDNVALPLRCSGFDRSKLREKVCSMLELVGIPEKVNALPGQLSGGQKQRVALARALCMEPKLLLCDEATSALDPNTAAAILRLLDHINRQLGLTIIFVTHQLFVLKQICDNVAVLEAGRVVDQGSISELYRKNSGPLNKLLGERAYPQEPGRQLLKLVYSREQMDQPVLLQMAAELKASFLILEAEKEFNIRQPLGYAVIQVADEDAPGLKQYLDRAGVAWTQMEGVKTHA